MAGISSVVSTITIFMPGLFAKSVTAAVGKPPTQKKASILRSFTALTDSATLKRSRLTSLSLSRPADSSRRNAMTSVALPGAPVLMRLPLRSFMVLMPVPSTVTTCMRFGYSTRRVRRSTFLPANLPSPTCASFAASAIEKPTYGLPVPIRFRLSTDPPVTSAVADMPGTLLESTDARPPPIG